MGRWGDECFGKHESLQNWIESHLCDWRRDNSIYSRVPLGSE